MKHWQPLANSNLWSRHTLALVFLPCSVLRQFSALYGPQMTTVVYSEEGAY